MIESHNQRQRAGKIKGAFRCGESTQTVLSPACARHLKQLACLKKSRDERAGPDYARYGDMTSERPPCLAKESSKNKLDI